LALIAGCSLNDLKIDYTGAQSAYADNSSGVVCTKFEIRDAYANGCEMVCTDRDGKPIGMNPVACTSTTFVSAFATVAGSSAEGAAITKLTPTNDLHLNAATTPAAPAPKTK
jgi:hypothetical protein